MQQGIHYAAQPEARYDEPDCRIARLDVQPERREYQKRKNGLEIHLMGSPDAKHVRMAVTGWA